MNTRLFVFLYAFFLIVVATATSCRAEVPVSPSVHAELAGVRYDSAAPLAAKVTPMFDPKNPPTEAQTFRAVYTGADGAVPALYTVPGDGRGAKRYPAVVVIHGLGSRKEDVLLLCVALARQGYATLAIDLAAHGERRLSGNRSLIDLSLTETRRSVAVSVTDLRRGVDFLSSRADVDKTRIGCLGVSLGGIYGAVFAGVEPRVAATALWSAGGDWGKLFTLSQQEVAVKRRESGNLPDEATIEATLRDVDPLTYVAGIAPRPLLLLAGTNDRVVPNVCTDALFDAAREPKTLERFRGGHVPDPRNLLVRTLTFFDTTLKARPVR